MPARARPTPPGAGTEPVVSRGVTIPAFYTTPAELPSANGTLIRQEPFPLAVSLPGGWQQAGATVLAWAVLAGCLIAFLVGRPSDRF